HLLKVEMLVEKFARRIVVDERQTRPGDAVVARRIIDDRDRHCLLGGAAYISDLYGEGLRPGERRRQEPDERPGYDCHDQGSTSTRCPHTRPQARIARGGLRKGRARIGLRPMFLAATSGAATSRRRARGTRALHLLATSIAATGRGVHRPLQ